MEEFDEWIEDRAQRTYDEPVPERDKNAPITRPVRIYKTVNELLGYDEAEHETARAVEDESSLGAEEAELLRQYEAGEISEEFLAGL